MASTQSIPDLPGDDLLGDPSPTPAGEPVAELVEVAINREAMVVTFRFRLRQAMSDGTSQDKGVTGVNLAWDKTEDAALEVTFGGQQVAARAALKLLNKSANHIRVCARDGLGPYAPENQT